MGRLFFVQGNRGANKIKTVPINYFAYGANVNLARMQARGVDVLNRQRAVLRGYGLRFNKRCRWSDIGFANVVVGPAEVVEGVLYQITSDGLAVLDQLEGHPREYWRDQKQVTVDCAMHGKTAVWAEVYVASADRVTEGLMPSESYLDDLLAGAEFFSGPYVQRLLEIRTAVATLSANESGFVL